MFLFLTLAVASIVTLTLLLMSLLGPAGIGVAAVLGIILGLVSSGGLAPLEALPGFYQSYAAWLPLRYILDGLRALLFYDGRSTAGLGDAVQVLGAYLTGSVILGYLISLIRTSMLGRKGKTGKTYDDSTSEAAQ